MDDNELKICGKCNILKSLKSFHKNKYGKNGYRSNCKECCNIYQSKYYKENLDNIKENYKKYYEENKEAISQRNINYNFENKEIINKRRYLKLENNHLEKRALNLRSSTISFLKSNINKINSNKSNIENILGCSKEKLKNHFEQQFEDWMNWENQGGRGIRTQNTNWDVDHIIPLSSAKTEEELIILCHYTNLRPLCSYINRYIKK